MTYTDPHCPVCQAPVEPDIPVCLHCGYDLRRPRGDADPAPPDDTASTDTPVVVRRPDPPGLME